jgi:hypothetical protein
VSALSHLKLGLAAAGIILWGYGARADVNWLRWAGIGFLAVAAVLRFVKRRTSPSDQGDGSDPTA